MSDIVFIEQLRIDTIIGVYDWERNVKQTLVFDVEMATDISKAGASDNVADALDYGAVAERLKTVVGASRYQLLEALAEGVLTVLKDEFAVSWVRLRIAKPGAVADAKQVGLVVERHFQ